MSESRNTSAGRWMLDLLVVVGVVALIIMCPWLILVAVCASPLFLGVRKH